MPKLLSRVDTGMSGSASRRGDIAFTTFYTTRRFAAERRGACMALARAMAAVGRDAGQT